LKKAVSIGSAQELVFEKNSALHSLEILLANKLNANIQQFKQFSSEKLNQVIEL